MAIDSLENLVLDELRELYSAERIALRAYPRMRKLIQTPSLQEAVDRHLDQTREQVERLGKAFELMDAKTRGKTCHSMQGLVEEAQEHLEMDLSPELLEAMLVTDLQKIEHLEIAAYGAARAHAEALGMEEIQNLLQQTLEEEKETDRLLNQIALDEINPEAAGASSGEDAEPEGEGEDESEEPAESSSKKRPSRGRFASTKGGDDLKSREYRDRQGNVHHHTRTAR
jgi:ferritin-like metal-binding protein YciE